MTPLQTSLPGVLLLEPRIFNDPRGFIFESYNQRTFAALGIEAHFVQDNHSRSVKGTLRGLHFQLHHPQAKLCRVAVGEVLDVAADIRPGSPTFGQWTSTVLSAENHRQIFIPRGFAHGFLVLSEVAEFLYKCDDFYYPDDECGIAWNDPTFAIPWDWEKLGIAEPLLSEKDKKHPPLLRTPHTQLPLYQESN